MELWDQCATTSQSDPVQTPCLFPESPTQRRAYTTRTARLSYSASSSRFQGATPLLLLPSLLPKIILSASRATRQLSANVSGTYPSTIKLVRSSRTTTMSSSLSPRMFATPSSRLRPPYPRPTLWTQTAAQACVRSRSPHNSTELPGSHSPPNRSASRQTTAHKVSFRVANVTQIFSALSDFPPARAALVVDPLFKGCDDEAFIRQLLAFRAQAIVD
jgi:hypothetical protein